MKKEKKKDKKIIEKCKCEKNAAKAPHTCPFKSKQKFITINLFVIVVMNAKKNAVGKFE